MRQSNIELCRLASILLVMLVHSTTSSLGYEVSLGVHLLTGFTVIGVNVFVLITGYFSTNPKKSSLANLAFICLFWMIVRVVCRYGFGEPVTFKHLFFITSSNWFIASYIGLLFLTPILNSFCKSVPQKTALGGGNLFVNHRDVVRLVATASRREIGSTKWLFRVLFCGSIFIRASY